MREILIRYKKYIHATCHGIKNIQVYKKYVYHMSEMLYIEIINSNIIALFNTSGKNVIFIIMKKYWSLDLTLHRLPYIVINRPYSNDYHLVRHFSKLKRGSYTSIVL